MQKCLKFIKLKESMGHEGMKLEIKVELKAPFYIKISFQ
jgi:hypothetical protein